MIEQRMKREYLLRLIGCDLTILPHQMIPFSGQGVIYYDVIFKVFPQYLEGKSYQKTADFYYVFSQN